MHRFIPATLTLLAVLLTATLACAAPKAPADMMLAPPAAMKASKTPVAFSHDLHGKAEVQCTTCHHTWDGKSEIQSCASAGCHDQPGKKGPEAYYTAFHSKKKDNSCLGCHKIVKKQGKVVPVSCKECHPK
ncbi:cytochrome C [Pseudodesulfovibrio cashew]|uniref:Cytochrome C n=1 Tax=Pseudodesulfovibrio cashew TaxID=2678688 RepID=A0A6I6JUW2_9BACT|nr:cytochrome c3 family protein [Pseudodesulfovibrio cashew]QGY41504.1 cytochrome C [Pseudodesulfovibrio cashew]